MEHFLRNGAAMRALVMAAIVACVPSAARAQQCLGLPSFANPIRVTGTAQFGDGFSFYAGGIGAGKSGSLFGSVGGGVVDYDGVDEKSTVGFIEGGYELVSRGAIRACPVAGASIEKVPDGFFGADVDGSARTAVAGLALSALFSGMPGLDLVPNGSVRYVYSSLKVDDPILGSETESQSSGLLDLGIALLLNDWFSIQPTVQIPFGGDDNSTSFGIFVGIGFGKKR
jgi:hypothetical protein